MKWFIAVPLLLVVAIPLRAGELSIANGTDAQATKGLDSYGFETVSASFNRPPSPPIRVPRTPFDTAHRFNMDSSKKLTAAEFDIWLASMGARVVGAEVEGATAATAEDAVRVTPHTLTPPEVQPAPAAVEAVRYQLVR